METKNIMIVGVGGQGTLLASKLLGRMLLGRGCDVKARELSPYYRKTAELVGAHFIDAAQCEFNQIDHMHLTRRGHAQLAQLLAQAVPGLLA